MKSTKLMTSADLLGPKGDRLLRRLRKLIRELKPREWN
jgi:hypothetical protein